MRTFLLQNNHQMNRLALLLLCTLLMVVTANKYQNDSMIYVHMIPHTHDDVGWLKTIEEYYYGKGNGGSQSMIGIQYIIEAVINELIADSEKRFSWVEVGYFYRYWINQNQEFKDKVKILVDEGRLEFISGGWAMHDEAVTYYEDMIDNMALGHKFLSDNLGVVPKVGWQIDPFGHSSTNAALFSKAGIDAFWFSRIDYAEKRERQSRKDLEFIWQPRTTQGNENQILSIVTPDHYDFPSGFCFDFNCQTRQPPVVDDQSLKDYNVDRVAEQFVNYINRSSDTIL